MNLDWTLILDKGFLLFFAVGILVLLIKHTPNFIRAINNFTNSIEGLNNTIQNSIKHDENQNQLLKKLIESLQSFLLEHDEKLKDVDHTLQHHGEKLNDIYDCVKKK